MTRRGLRSSAWRRQGCPACAADVGFGFSTGKLTTWGTVTAAATITAAEVAVIASLRILRRRARRLISSKVPGGGGSGLMRSLSQSSSRRGGQPSRSPSAVFSLARAANRSALMVPSGRRSSVATSRIAKPP